MTPAVFRALVAFQIAHINLAVGVLIWIMIVPMLMRVDCGALSTVHRHWRGFGVTLFVNWAVKPFSMALLGWMFVRHVFAAWLPSNSPWQPLSAAFGFTSGAALATVVGVLIEVPAMLAVVWIVNRSRFWCERRVISWQTASTRPS